MKYGLMVSEKEIIIKNNPGTGLMVRRYVRDVEIPGSNPGSPTQSNIIASSARR